MTLPVSLSDWPRRWLRASARTLRPSFALLGCALDIASGYLTLP